MFGVDVEYENCDKMLMSIKVLTPGSLSDLYFLCGIAELEIGEAGGPAAESPTQPDRGPGHQTEAAHHQAQLGHRHLPPGLVDRRHVEDHHGDQDHQGQEDRHQLGVASLPGQEHLLGGVQLQLEGVVGLLLLPGDGRHQHPRPGEQTRHALTADLPLGRHFQISENQKYSCDWRGQNLFRIIPRYNEHNQPSSTWSSLQ